MAKLKLPAYTYNSVDPFEATKLRAVAYAHKLKSPADDRQIELLRKIVDGEDAEVIRSVYYAPEGGTGPRSMDEAMTEAAVDRLLEAAGAEGIVGTGAGGKITAPDVLAWHKAKAKAALETEPETDEEGKAEDWD